MNKANVPDRRRFPRMRSNRLVEIVRSAVRSRPIEATMRDVSQTGAMLISSVPIPLGESVVIRPSLKGAGFEAEIVAIVERHAPSESGDAHVACRFPELLDYSVVRLFQ